MVQFNDSINLFTYLLASGPTCANTRDASKAITQTTHLLRAFEDISDFSDASRSLAMELQQ